MKAIEFSKLSVAIEQQNNKILLARDVCYDNKIIKRYYLYESYKDVEKVLEKNDYCYEVFQLGKKCNFFVDLDITDEEGLKDSKKRVDEIDKVIKKCLIEYIKLHGINIDDSQNSIIRRIKLKSNPTDLKASYHLIYRIKNIYFKDVLVCKNFYEFMTITKNITLLGIDKSVYSKNRCFRLVNNSKINHPDNPLKLITKNVKLLETMGSYVKEDTSDIILNGIVIKKNVKQPKKIVEEQIIEDYSIVEKLLDCLNISFATNYDDWNKLGILLYCITNGDNKGLELWCNFLKDKNPDKYDEDECKRFYDNYSNLEDKRYTIGTLYYWAKSSDKQKYDQLFEKDYLYCLTVSSESVARTFCRRYSNKFFKEESGNWYEFNDKTGIWRQIPSSLSSLYMYISKMADDYQMVSNNMKDDDLTKLSIDELVKKLRTIGFKNQVIAELNWLMEVEMKTTNNNDKILPFNNGVYDLENMVFRPGYYEEYVTITTGYDYNIAPTELAERYLRDIFIDERKYQYALNLLSSSLDNVRYGEAFHIFFNRLGSNGKSYLMEWMNDTLGNFACAIPVQLILNDSTDAEAASPAKMLLKNKRFVYSQEPPKEATFCSSVIKRLTGGDEISGRNLNSGIEKFHFNGLLISACNDLPLVDVVDGGFIRRVYPLKFETLFVDGEPKNPNERKKRNMDAKDKKNLILPLINLLINNYPNFISSSKEVPDFILKERKKYIENSDLIIRFIDDYIIKDPNGIITKKEIRYLYQTEKENYDLPRKYSAFVRDLEARLETEFVRDKKINGERYKDVITGYSLKEEK